MNFLGPALGAASAIQGILAGAAVTIGNVELAGLEVPATLPFGGTQATVVHDFPGGGRVVDTMGAHDRDIEWSGTFMGVSAVSRARSLDALRIAGKPVTLTWADFTRKVVIKQFDAEYGYGGGVIPYKVSCVVLPNPKSAAIPGLLESLKSDLNAAVGFDVGAVAGKAVAVAQAALPVIAVVTRGSPSYFALASAVGTAAGAVGAVKSLADSSLANQAASVLSSGGTFGGMSGLLTASASQTVLATATQSAALLGRAVKNLGSA